MARSSIIIPKALFFRNKLAKFFQRAPNLGKGSRAENIAKLETISNGSAVASLEKGHVRRGIQVVPAWLLALFVPFRLDMQEVDQERGGENLCCPASAGDEKSKEMKKEEAVFF